MIVEDGFQINPGHLLSIGNEVEIKYCELSDAGKQELVKTLISQRQDIENPIGAVRHVLCEIVVT